MLIISQSPNNLKQDSPSVMSWRQFGTFSLAPSQLCCSSNRCMILTNGTVAKSEMNKLYFWSITSLLSLYHQHSIWYQSFFWTTIILLMTSLMEQLSKQELFREEKSGDIKLWVKLGTHQSVFCNSLRDENVCHEHLKSSQLSRTYRLCSASRRRAYLFHSV